jgi:hypothetical protein
MKSFFACLTSFVVCASCAPNETPEAYLWSVRDMLEPDEREGGIDQDFGGWKPRQLVVPVDQALFFEENESALHNAGLVVQPGVSEGVSAPFVITEVWKNHPVPWVQPVWSPKRADGSTPLDLVNVFSVNDDATFYSPFWQLEVVVSDALDTGNPGFRSAREVFALMDKPGTTHTAGPLVYCPVVPADVLYAESALGVRDPITLALLASPTAPKDAWAEGVKIKYLPMGVDRFQVSDQLPIASRAYFFVTRAGEAVLPVAAVLPASPKTHAFVTRVDVVLPAGAGVYVPSTRPALRARLIDAGVPAPLPSAANEGVTARALQVALDAECFKSGDIATCKWLDSEAALTAAGVVLAEQPVQLAVAVVDRK